ncbi:type B 50S ribosomal protein L31 [Candidatus Karelsulcia muelleri]|uniref:50S ribosomal protein L31 n=1 Tax=Candidatus Karelsulcia muelleri PSPU TaxID=1189303 RepID=A0AAD1AZE9_9FLAO|nr:type B 50S ribosomal protein L31 [Candidatus Karelsulcia muelleri]NJJ98730.1 type B 50S ribosomal protein L31 [Candidatus Karelsulcia muelleri]BAO66382.1 50S ribosomal protein L31 [Candidatus Karelsulcia muelleri PSPU]
MKKKIHPNNYRIVVFKDMTSNDTFFCKSTLLTKEKINLNGKEFTLYKMEISSFSHPFYTGQIKYVDATGRIDKFYKKYKKKK